MTKLKPPPSFEEVEAAYAGVPDFPSKPVLRRCLPHTCYRGVERRSPFQWGMFDAGTCDGCLAQAMQGDDDPDTRWTVDKLVDAFSDQRRRVARFRGRTIPDAEDQIAREADRLRIFRVQEQFMAIEPTVDTRKR